MKALRLVTVKMLVSMPEYSWLTEASIRQLIFYSQPSHNSKNEEIAGNGLKESGAIIRIGRRVLIDLDCFDAWVVGHREK